MQPKFWLILKYKPAAYTIEKHIVLVEEFEDREELNTFIALVNTEDLVSLEVISGFSLVKRVQ